MKITIDALNYFHGNELAANVWKSKYALKKDGIALEDNPAEMHIRMAKEFTRIEEKYKSAVSYDHIKELLLSWSVIPQGSVMAILGNPHQIGSLSNCVVLPKIYDSYGGINYTDQQLAQVMKRRCGAGIDISTLRPSGTLVSNAAQTSTGAVSFMHRFSNTTREVAQDGRRGALMISMDIRHPEAEQFATIKQDLTKVTGANISLKLTDEFMEAVENNENFFHRFPIDTKFDDNKSIFFLKNARSTWDTIIKAAHNTAEPGLIFWDRQHYYSPSSLYKEFENISTNPCSEIAMGNDTCRLIAKNMFSCVALPFTHSASFDFDEWYWTCYHTMKLMDDLVDLELENINKIIEKIDKDDEPQFIKEVERKTWMDLLNAAIRGRRTGAGVTAVGDTLAALGLRYDSDKALDVFEQIMRVKLGAELDATIDMAEERGAFPAFDAQLEAEQAKDPRTFFYFLKQQYPDRWARMQKSGRRNVSWSTIAPSGSLSLLARLSKRHFGTTSGIEPLFKIYYIRRKKINPNDKETRVDFVDASGDKWQEFPVFHEGFKMWYEINQDELGLKDTPLEEITGSLELGALIALSPYAGSTAEEINWKKRVQLQAIAQKYITHSISSTINLPNNVTEDEVGEIYMESWKQGLKGITVYRDGSRSGVLVSADRPTPKEEGIVYNDAPKRPAELKAEAKVVSVKGMKYSVITGFLDDKPYEIFAFYIPEEAEKYIVNGKGVIKKNKNSYTFVYESGYTVGDLNQLTNLPDEQMLTRLVSGMLRHGVNPVFIVQQIEKCPLEIVSFGKALARTIKRFIPEKELISKSKCKDCGSTNLVYEEGCSRCTDCGSSKCS